MILTGGKPVPLALCPPQIPHRKTCYRLGGFRGEGLTTNCQNPHVKLFLKLADVKILIFGTFF